MSMTPREVRTLREISEQLAVSDPRLARRLCKPVPPISTAREVAVMAVLLGWVVLGFLPVALGLKCSQPMLVGMGVVTTFIGTPVLMWATLWWVRRYAFVRFCESKPP